MSASTTTCAVRAMKSALPPPVRHQHEKGDAAAGAENNRGTHDMGEFQDEIDQAAHSPAARLGGASFSKLASLAKKSYAKDPRYTRANLLYLILCGWSASMPRRRFLSAS